MQKMMALHASLEAMEDNMSASEKAASMWLPVGDVLLENLDSELVLTKVAVTRLELITNTSVCHQNFSDDTILVCQ